MGIAHPARCGAGGQKVHRLIGHDRGGNVEQGHVDMLAAPGRGALMQGGQNGGGGIDAGENVGHGDADLLRLAVRLSGDAHQAGHALDDEVIAGAMRIGAGLAEAGDRAIDQARVERGERGIVQPVFRKAPDLEILDHHIGVGHQATDGFLAPGRAEIDGDRFLAPVGGMKIGRRPILFAVDERGAPAAGVIPLGRFDLDHIRAQIRQGLTGPGAGQNPGQFDHAQSGKGGWHRSASQLFVENDLKVFIAHVAV